MSEFICYRIENNYAVDCENNKITLGELVTVINKTINTSVANAEKIKKLQAKLAKKDEQIKEASRLILSAKKSFAPNTTNSEADDYINKYGIQEREGDER